MNVTTGPSDDTWEEFFGPPTDLSPVMDCLDAILEYNRENNKNAPETTTTASAAAAKKTYQANNFAHLSPCVQKILSHVDDQEINNKFKSEEVLSTTTSNHSRSSSLRRFSNYNRSMKSPERVINKSAESLDFSPNVQKMISNFPETELVIPPIAVNCGRNNSFLHKEKTNLINNGDQQQSNNNNNLNGLIVNDRECELQKTTVVYHSEVKHFNSDCDNNCENGGSTNNNNSDCWEWNTKPLGSYLHSSQGIASRTPVGRKNIGKYLQVPSESTISSTASSSEVSRPVSLTSLGSCSSSGSSNGHNQPGSAYLASAESLDSDPEPTGSQGSADSGIAEQPTMSPEQRVLQEVLDTETVYVSDLNEVIQGYLEPWRMDLDGPLYTHLSSLFSNIEEIYKFNRSFLDSLRKADCDPTKTANVFIQNNNGFVVYNEYCTNYPRTMDILGELTRDDNISALFREKQIALGHALPLGSYLLKPVQRILKYHLLLQRLSKQCEPQHKSAVDLALTTMTSVACNINSMKRKHEHAVRVHEIQSQLYGWSGPDLTALGELIAEGTFRVNGARGRRHVFLFDKVLLMAKNKQDGALAYKSHIMCSNLMLVEQVRGEPLSFQVIPFDNPRLQCTLRARSPQHKREWTLQIKRVILENYTAEIPFHARQLVMSLGNDCQDTEETDKEKWSPLNKSSTPHYLERRSRVRKSRDLTGGINRRTSSQDRSFVSLGNWRRKSEPGIVTVPQYNTKTVPKKISKIKKAKESGAKFYTDLYDSENCENNEESLDSFDVSTNSMDCSDKQDNQEVEKNPENNLEKIVSDLLMQNQEFNRVMNKPRRTRGSEPDTTNTWFEDQHLPKKANSLPRSVQLNDQIENGDKDVKQVYESVKEDVDGDDQQENDLSSHLDNHEHPVHKIYRQTPIRTSLLHRLRAVLSSENEHGSSSTHKYLLRKLGSKSMGEKIAHPDYADPQKLFQNSSCNTSSINLSADIEPTECDSEEVIEPLDMTINESEVLNEFEKRLNNCNRKPEQDTGQQHGDSSRSTINHDTNIIDTSRNSDGYYEKILDTTLVEEYTKDENGKLVAKQDSFRNGEMLICSQKYKTERQEKLLSSHICQKSDQKLITTTIKRPTKPPPPIPVKPTRLIQSSCSTKLKIVKHDESKEEETITVTKSTTETAAVVEEIRGKSWVKTMVGRFE